MKEKALLTILYGTHSGNSKYIAKTASKVFKKNGIENTCIDVGRYNFDDFHTEENVLLVMSTHGDGVPPSSAKKFYKKLMKLDTKLGSMNFSVCALGDKSYDKFCQTGLDIHKKLQLSGAKQITDLVKCDVDYQQPVQMWLKFLVNHFKGGKAEVFDVEQAPKSDFNGRIVSRKRLNAPSSGKEVIELKLKIKDPGFSCLPGDTLAILPKNNAIMVYKIWSLLNTEHYTSPEAIPSLIKSLINDYELSLLSLKFFKHYNVLAGSKKLEKLILSKKVKEKYSSENALVNLMQDFPVKLSPDELIAMLKPIRPRYYSVSSLWDAETSTIDLLLRTLDRGVATNYLGHRLETGSRISVRHARNEQFRLPAQKDVPVIMVANGVGLAPFRAFLQQMKNEGRKHKTWLLYGDRSRKTDFIYENEFMQFHTEGVLSKLSLAFSRDEESKYVQHTVSENQKKISKWIKNGAHVYVCGSTGMGKEVKHAIKQTMALKGNKSGIDQLKKEGRYFVELF